MFLNLVVSAQATNTILRLPLLIFGETAYSEELTLIVRNAATPKLVSETAIYVFNGQDRPKKYPNYSHNASFTEMQCL